LKIKNTIENLNLLIEKELGNTLTLTLVKFTGESTSIFILLSFFSKNLAVNHNN